MNLMKERQNSSIIESYYYRLKILGINIYKTDFINRLKKMDYNLLNDFLTKLILCDKKYIISSLNSLKIPTESNEFISQNNQTNSINYDSSNKNHSALIDSNNDNTTNNKESPKGKQYVLSTKYFKSDENESKLS